MDIEQFTYDKTWSDYQENSMMRSAVERQFIIIGEAFSRITSSFPDSRQRVQQARKIINFRNFLSHEYEDIDDRVVWTVVQEDLVPFKENIAQWVLDIKAAKTPEG